MGLSVSRSLCKIAWTAVLVLAALVFSACPPTASTTGYQHLNSEIDEHLRKVGLDTGDVFEVRVYGEPELSGIHRIAEDGTIDVPLVGRLEVRGLNRGQIATKLEDSLRDGFIRSPSVSVFVKEYNSRKIFVLGQVRNPGTFAYVTGMSVVEAITRSGGFLPTANANLVVVTRQVNGEDQRITVPVDKISQGLASNLQLQAGDIIFVSDRLL